MFNIASVSFPLIHSVNIVYVPQSFQSRFIRVVRLSTVLCYCLLTHKLTHSTNEPRSPGWVVTLLTVVVSIDHQGFSFTKVKIAGVQNPY